MSSEILCRAQSVRDHNNPRRRKRGSIPEVALRLTNISLPYLVAALPDPGLTLSGSSAPTGMIFHACTAAVAGSKSKRVAMPAFIASARKIGTDTPPE